MNTILNTLIPCAVTAIGGYLTVRITKIIPSVVQLSLAKLGLTDYEKMKSIAWDIWKAIEEDGRLGKLVDNKINTFESMIRKRFPDISDDDIKLLNKSIAGEVNKGKEAVTSAINTVTITQEQLVSLQAKAQVYDQIQSTITTTASTVQANTVTPNGQ